MAYGGGSITEVKKRDGSSYAPKHRRICINLGTDPITGERQTFSLFSDELC